MHVVQWSLGFHCAQQSLGIYGVRWSLGIPGVHYRYSWCTVELRCICALSIFDFGDFRFLSIIVIGRFLSTFLSAVSLET